MIGVFRFSFLRNKFLYGERIEPHDAPKASVLATSRAWTLPSVLRSFR